MANALLEFAVLSPDIPYALRIDDNIVNNDDDELI